MADDGAAPLPPGGPGADERTARFAAEVGRGEGRIRVDEAALLLASHADAQLDVDASRSELDSLAVRSGASKPAEVVAWLFATEGFTGASRYYDPRNSYLDQVLLRREGIPISLSVLTLGVARRLGLDMVAIGLPGHVVLGAPDVVGWWDPFHDGRALDRDGAARLVAATTGMALDDSHLRPMGEVAILARMLANLAAIFRSGEDRASLLWVLRLRCCLPIAGPADLAHLAALAAATGRFAEAAQIEAHLGAVLADDEVADEHRRRSAALQARLN